MCYFEQILEMAIDIEQPLVIHHTKHASKMNKTCRILLEI